MALRFSHWCVALFIACALVALAFIPPRKVERNAPILYLGDTPARQMENRLRRRLAAERSALLTTFHRDSAIAAADSMDLEPSQVAVVTSEDFPHDWEAALRRLVQAYSVRHGATHEGPRLVFFATLDTALVSRSVQRSAQTRYHRHRVFVPSVTDGRTCVTVLAFGPAAVRSRERPNSSPGEMVQLRRSGRRFDPPLGLGPCGFYAAFGHPGPHILEWLERHRFAPAMEANWATASYSYWPYDVLNRSTRASRYVWYSFAPEVLGCGAGDPTTCEQAILHPRIPPMDRFAFVRGMPWIELTGGSAGSMLGGREAGMLADLVREIGPERFAAFWRSTESVKDAFADAVGADIGIWTQHWVQETIGQWDQPRSFELPGVLLLVAVCGLCVVGAARIAQTRNV